jgi:hypothetical protein
MLVHDTHLFDEEIWLAGALKRSQQVPPSSVGCVLRPILRSNARFAHLVAGIEQQSLLVGAIAAASPFQAEPESNYTLVQRIITFLRITEL